MELPSALSESSSKKKICLKKVTYISRNGTCYNHFHNTLRLLDVSPTFLFTASETMRDYYLYTSYIPVAS